MQTYDDLLKNHALKSLIKQPQNADFKLAIGEAENLFPHTSIQQSLIVPPVSKALIEPNLQEMQEMGLVGDGIGVVSEKDFDTKSFDLGLPIEIDSGV